MPTFEYVGEKPTNETGDGDPVVVVHPDRGGESLRHFAPGDTFDAAENPDPSRFDAVEEAKPAGPAELPAGEVSTLDEAGTADV